MRECGLSLLLAYLARIHFKFPDYLDGDLSMLPMGVSGSVHVAEGAVTHLLEQSPSLQAGVLGEFASTLSLLSHDAFQNSRIYIFLALSLVFSSNMSCNILGSCGGAPIIYGGS
jgi:hypothetical protein